MEFRKETIKDYCFGCGHEFPDGETFVEIGVSKEEYECPPASKYSKEFQPHDSTIYYSFCMKCAKKKDFNNPVVPDVCLENPNKKDMKCCLCGKIIPDKTLMFNVIYEEVELDGGVTCPQVSDIVRTYCMECSERKDFEGIIIPNKEPIQ